MILANLPRKIKEMLTPQTKMARNGDGEALERISRLETAMDGIHVELGDIKGALRAITDLVSRGRETNWSVVFGGIAIVIALYGSAIRPLEMEAKRQQDYQAKLAEAVIVANDKRSLLENEMVRIKGDLAAAQSSIKSIAEFGSPITDRRLTLLEFQLGQRLNVAAK